MHGGACVGLGQDQRIDRARLRHVMRRHRLQVARLALLAAAHQAQASGFVGAQKFAAALADHVVLAVAEEGEMVVRSEEHTSELQSLMRLSYAVFCLKKKTQTTKINNNYNKTIKH